MKRSQAVQGAKFNRLGIVFRDSNRLLDLMRHGLNDLLEVFVIQFIRSLPVGQWLNNDKSFFISFVVISIQSRVWLGYWIAFGAGLSDQ